MKNRMRMARIRPHVVLLVLLTLLSILGGVKARKSYKTFIDSNVRIYDGVMYEHQELIRHQSFNGDFSFINRYNQAIYELNGNFHCGGYHALLSMFAPQWLLSDFDIFFRGIIGLFLLFVGVFVFFRPVLSIRSIGMILLVISQLPSLSNHSNGIGTYVPDLISAMYLLAGLLFILTFIHQKNSILPLFLGSFLVVLSTFFRFNFVVYAGIIFIPLSVPVIRALMKSSIAYRVLGAATIVFALATLSYYSIPRFTYFLYYYTKVTYGFTDVSSSIIGTFHEFVGLNGLIGFLTILYAFLISAFSNRKSELAPWAAMALILPFVALFSIINFVQRTPHVPHVQNATYLTLILAAIGLGALITPQVRSYILSIPLLRHLKSRTVHLVVGFMLVIASNVSYAKELNRLASTLPYHSGLFEFQKLLLTKKQTSQQPIEKYLVFFVEMASIPINLWLSKDHKITMPAQTHFYMQPNLMQNATNCQQTRDCVAFYLKACEDVDLIAINNPDGNENSILNQYPLAKGVSTEVFRWLSKDDSGFVATDTIESSVHGSIIVFNKNPYYNRP